MKSRPLDDGFAAALADWNAFYAMAGGAVATLLGFLFVPASHRLDIFRRRDVADACEFPAFTFGTFPVALAVAGLALAPLLRRPTLAVPLLALGPGGLVVVAALVREWHRPNPPSEQPGPGLNRGDRQAWIYLGALALPFAGIVIVATLLWADRGGALAGSAVVEGLLLVTAPVRAWLMLARPGASTND